MVTTAAIRTYGGPRPSRSWLGADLGVSTAGVGGTDPDDGHPAGTVFIAVTSTDGEPTVTEHHFNGSPSDVVQAATLEALKLLHATLS